MALRPNRGLFQASSSTIQLASSGILLERYLQPPTVSSGLLSSILIVLLTLSLSLSLSLSHTHTHTFSLSIYPSLWFCLMAAMTQCSGIICVIICGLSDCNRKRTGVCPDYARKMSGRYQIPCWTRLALLYISALYTFEVLSPKPHLIPWLLENDPWRYVNLMEGDAEQTVLTPSWLLEWGLLWLAIAVVLVLTPNEELWASWDTVRHDVYPRHAQL